MINRVFIGSDPLMTSASEQAKNREWLVQILRAPLRRATGLEAAPFSSVDEGDLLLTREKFFTLSSIALDKTQTQFWFDDATISAASLDYLATFLKPTDLFIGYELSPQTRALFGKLGVAWIDIWLHPIRFLDDLLFAFSASSAAVYEAMKPFHISEDVFTLYADRLRVQYGRGFARRRHPLQEGAALFIGQTMEDKAVCHQGKNLSLLDYKKDFEKAGRDYGRVYYSRHPYQRTGDEAIMTYVRSCPFAEVTEWPAYDLISSGALGKVFAISSSLVHEAQYFGLKTAFLFQPPLRYGTTFGKEYLSIYQTFVSPHFWAQALAPLMQTKPCEPIIFLSGKDKLRDMLGYYWSYHHIDKTESLRRDCWNLGQRVEKLEHSRSLLQTIKEFFS